jgi:membrane fusion protein (multidrug efflux system)
VVQRVPVRIQLDKNQPLLERLLPGMSVVTNINTGEAGADGGK